MEDSSKEKTGVQSEKNEMDVPEVITISDSEGEGEEKEIAAEMKEEGPCEEKERIAEVSAECGAVNEIAQEEKEEDDPSMLMTDQYGGAVLKVRKTETLRPKGKLASIFTTVGLEIELSPNLTNQPDSAGIFAEQLVALLKQNIPKDRNVSKAGIVLECSEFSDDVGHPFELIDRIKPDVIEASMAKMVQSGKDVLNLDDPTVKVYFTYITAPTGSGKRVNLGDILELIHMGKKSRREETPPSETDGDADSEDESVDMGWGDECMESDGECESESDDSEEDVSIIGSDGDTSDDEEEVGEDVVPALNTSGTNIMVNKVTRDCLPHALYQAEMHNLMKNNPTNENKNKYRSSIRKTCRMRVGCETVFLAVKAMKKKAGVRKNGDFDKKDIEKFQKKVYDGRFQIICFVENSSIPLYCGPFVDDKKILTIYLSNDHFAGVKTIPRLLKSKYYYSLCNVRYSNVANHYACPLVHRTCGQKKCPQNSNDVATQCEDCTVKFRSKKCYENHKKKGPRKGKSRCEHTSICEKCTEVMYTNVSRRLHVCGSKYCHRCETARPQPHHSIFNFYDEILRYCFNDVFILASAIQIFEKEFEEMTNVCLLEESTTAVSAAAAVFRRNHLEYLKPIVLDARPGISMNSSIISQKYLAWFGELEDINVECSTTYGEKKIGKHRVDGFVAPCEKYPDGLIIEFFGCYYHAHDCTFSKEAIVRNETAEKIRARDAKKTRELEDHHPVEIVWECEVRKMLKNDNTMRKFFDTYDVAGVLQEEKALVGGRTEVFKLISANDDGEIHYKDVVSLYPSVMKKSAYPIGPPTNVEQKDIKVPMTTPKDIRFRGFLYCRIQPPRQLGLPLLPIKANGKLVFVFAYTTSYARLQLYKYMELVGDEAIVYTDTDSIVYKVPRGKRDPLSQFCGPYLGQLTNELAGTMLEFVTIGPKSYCYKDQLADGTIQVVRKAKGITINSQVDNELTFDLMKKMVEEVMNKTNTRTEVTFPQHTMRRDDLYNVFSMEIFKKFRYTFNKRRVFNDGTTKPYGYCDN